MSHKPENKSKLTKNSLNIVTHNSVSAYGLPAGFCARRFFATDGDPGAAEGSRGSEKSLDATGV